MTRALILIVCFSLGAESLHKEKFYYLTGMAGDKKITVKMELFGDLWFGRFFYNDQKKDLVLKGKCDSVKCEFAATRWEPQKNKETIQASFHIEETPEHHWVGIWTDGQGQGLPLHLKPIHKDSIQHPFGYLPFVKKLDPYSYFRSSLVKFSKTKTTSQEGNTIEWWSDDVGRIMMPRLGKGFTSQQRDSTNKTLAELHFKEIENYASCTSASQPGEYESNVEIKFVNRDLVSFILSTRFKCHSNIVTQQQQPFTINTHSGKIASLEDLFWFGPSDTSVPLPESQPWFDYRYKIFGDTITATLKRLYPEKMQASSPCNYADPKSWQFPTWYLTPKGLYVGAFLPGIDRSCDNPAWSFIPYTDLSPYKNKELVLP